jgi:hypothetical protein
LPHATSHYEKVALADGPVSLAEVRGKENIKQRASDAFDSVGNGQDSDSLGLFGVSSLIIRQGFPDGI